MTEYSREYYKEYYKQNKGKIIKYQKVYNQDKKGDIKEYQREYYLKRKAERKRRREQERKPLAKYLLDKIEAVIKKKLREYNKLKEKEKERQEGLVVAKVENKYYEKKKMMKYQYSLPQAEPFADFINTEKGFLLKW